MMTFREQYVTLSLGGRRGNDTLIGAGGNDPLSESN
jgi:hypothetical protein